MSLRKKKSTAFLGPMHRKTGTCGVALTNRNDTEKIVFKPERRVKANVQFRELGNNGEVLLIAAMIKYNYFCF